MRFSRRLRDLLVRCGYYIFLLFGTTAVYMDFKRKRMREEPWLKIYSFVVNVVVVSCIPMTYKYFMISMNYMFIHQRTNKLMQMVLISSYGINVGAMLFTMAVRWHGEGQKIWIMQKLDKLEEDYFGAQPEQVEISRHFERYVQLKYFSLIFQNFVTVGSNFWSMQSMSLIGWISTMSFGLAALNVLHAGLSQYLAGVCHITHRVCLINKSLESMFRTLCSESGGKRSQQLQQRAMAREMKTLAALHYRLWQIACVMNAAYRCQLLASLMTQMFNNIVIGYSIYAFFMDGSRPISIDIDLLYTLFVYAIYILDPYLTNLICDDLQMAQHDTQLLLCRINEIDGGSLELTRSIDFYSRLLAICSFRSNLCGMLHLSKATAFLLFAATIKQTIILVQFDIDRVFEK